MANIGVYGGGGVVGGAAEITLSAVKTAVELIDDTVGTDGAAVPAKVLAVAGTDGTNAQTLKTDADGELQIDVLSSALPSGASTESTLTSLLNKTAGALIPVSYDELALTYVTVGNGIGQVATVVYKAATVTVATLTLSYDANDKLVGVVRT